LNEDILLETESIKIFSADSPNKASDILSAFSVLSPKPLGATLFNKKKTDFIQQAHSHF